MSDPTIDAPAAQVAATDSPPNTEGGDTELDRAKGFLEQQTRLLAQAREEVTASLRVCELLALVVKASDGGDLSALTRYEGLAYGIVTSLTTVNGGLYRVIVTPGGETLITITGRSKPEPLEIAELTPDAELELVRYFGGDLTDPALLRRLTERAALALATTGKIFERGTPVSPGTSCTR